MTVVCLVNYKFWIIFLLQMCNFVKLDPASKSGPYKSMIVSVNDCSTTSRPLMTNPPMLFETSINNSTGRSMLSGNLTVLRDVQNVKSKMKSFVWHNDKWELNYMINNVDCHGMLVHLMSVATKVKYDRKKCMYMKGSYAYNNLDINQMHHLWASTMEYGKSMWRIEVYLPPGTIFCKEVDTLVEPAPQ